MIRFYIAWKFAIMLYVERDSIANFTKNSVLKLNILNWIRNNKIWKFSISKYKDQFKLKMCGYSFYLQIKSSKNWKPSMRYHGKQKSITKASKELRFWEFCNLIFRNSIIAHFLPDISFAFFVSSSKYLLWISFKWDKTAVIMMKIYMHTSMGINW